MGRSLEYAWFDADLLDHPKFIDLLGRDDGEHLFICWQRLVFWARKRLSPDKPEEAGIITFPVARHLFAAEAKSVIDALAEARLLDELLSGAWLLHDFAEHQDLAGWAKRQQRNVRGGLARAAQAAAQAQARQQPNDSLGSSPGSAHPIPSHPIPSTSPNGEVEHTPSFDDFWQTYPRRVAKGNAERAWIKALASGHDPLIIVHGAGTYAERCEANRTEPKYIAHPASWLNARRWEDEESDEPGRQEVAPQY